MFIWPKRHQNLCLIIHFFKSVKNLSFKFFRHKSSFSKFEFNNFTLNAVNFLTCRYEIFLRKQAFQNSNYNHIFIIPLLRLYDLDLDVELDQRWIHFQMSCIIRDSIILHLDTNSLQKKFYYRVTISFTTTSLLAKAPYPFHVWFWSFN